MIFECAIDITESYLVMVAGLSLALWERGASSLHYPKGDSDSFGLQSQSCAEIDSCRAPHDGIASGKSYDNKKRRHDGEGKRVAGTGAIEETVQKTRQGNAPAIPAITPCPGRHESGGPRTADSGARAESSGARAESSSAHSFGRFLRTHDLANSLGETVPGDSCSLSYFRPRAVRR